MPMTWVTLTDHTPLDNMVCRKQGGRSVALVVVSEGAAAARFEWQSWLSAIQGLNVSSRAKSPTSSRVKITHPLR